MCDEADALAARTDPAFPEPVFEPRQSPESILANTIAKDLGVTVNPQALRMFIRARWMWIRHLAHAIHKD